MKFVKTAAVLAAALLAVQCLPGFVREHYVDAETSNTQDAEIVDAMITGYEGNADDPETFRVITADSSSQPISTSSADTANLVHNSKYGAYFFTQAITVQEAIDEAKLCIARVKDYNITMPIYFDVEETEGNGCQRSSEYFQTDHCTAYRNC